MAQILSESEQEESSERRKFLPSLSEVLLYVLLSAILLAGMNSGTIINLLGTDYIGSAQNLNLNLDVLNNSVNTSLSTVFDGRLGQIIVWACIGAAAYVALWFLKNLLNSFENDVIIGHYLHPSSFSRAGYWGSAFAGKIFFGVLLILFITITYTAVKVVLPATSALGASALYHFNFPNSIMYILLAVFIDTVAIYLWVFFVRIISHLWKLI
jgi:hypothetical protein